MRVSLGLVLALGALAASSAAQTPLTTQLVGSGYAKPLWIGSPPGVTNRLYVVEQSTADVEVITNGVPNATPFIDLTAKVLTNANERGLLGFAFDPDFATNSHFYVSYTRVGDGASIVERYTAFSPDVANAGSGVVVFGPVTQPQSNHNGGHIAFGPDGKLYFGLGDGGNGNDTGSGHIEPGGNAQNGTTLLGKMVRINKDGTIPGDNPFVGNPGFLDQIWSYGLRNPWRWSFDRKTGDMWIADVGQNTREEINFEPAGLGGRNYGWRCMEGFLCTGLTGCTCNDVALTLPVKNYGHGSGKCSVTGGFVYRGDAIPDLAGTYFYADYCTAQIWTLKWNGVTLTEDLERTAELDPPGATAINFVTSFGEDGAGELYICDQNGELFKIVPNGPFKGLGCALPGLNGDPILHGEGSLVVGTAGSLELDSARPSSAAMLFVSLTAGSAPFKGGTLKAVPIVFTLPLFTSPTGEIDLSWTSWPSGLPVGQTLVFQYGVQDAAAVNGVALSNALQATQP